MERVLPDRVVLTDGRAFPRPGGASPRPGQTVIVDCRPGLIVLSPHAPSHLEQTAEAAFVPVQFYDSPQRPMMFQEANTGHHPYVAGAGVFAEEGPGFDILSGQVLDDGTRLRLSGGTEVDHQARTVKNLRRTGQTYQPLPDNEQGASLPRQSMINRGHTYYRLEPLYTSAGASVAWTDTVYAYAGGTTTQVYTQYGLRVVDRDRLGNENGQMLEGYRAGTWWSGGEADGDPGFQTRNIMTLGIGEFGGAPLGQARRFGPIEPGGPDLYSRELYESSDRQTIQSWASIGITNFTPRFEYYDVVRDGVLVHSFRLYDFPTPILDYLYVSEGRDTTTPPAPESVVWRSPDGLIRVDGPRTGTHSNLGRVPFALSTLTAYGQTRTGGSWAALCGPPTDPINPASAAAWVLHEAGGDVTLFKPNAPPETVTRAVFEQDVLRVDVGTFKAFDSYGTDAATWPMPWAIADCQGSGMRAVVLHDAWRDSVRGARLNGQPGPLSWYWPGRPRRAGLPGGPNVPLGLTLADVFAQEAAGS